MDQEEVKELQRRVLRTKKDLRKWEDIFSQKHKRPATIEDIKTRPNIEMVYKKYNHLKRELKKATDAGQMENISSQLSSFSGFLDSQEAPSSSSSSQRRGSIEYMKSPSQSGTRVNQYFHHDKREDRLKVRRLSEIEDMKIAIATSSSTTVDPALPEDEAFWLDVAPTSASQPLPTIAQEEISSPTSSTTSSSTQPPRLKLGGSQPKKNQRMSKSNPFHRRQRLVQQQLKVVQQNSKQQLEVEEQQQPEQQPEQQQEQRPNQMSFSQSTASQMDISDDEGDDMNGIEIVNHEENPFRNYDPSLFDWEDPTFSVGPGFFGSSKACSSFMVPILNEPSRRDRILRKIEKGTLGEVLEENQVIEDELDEEIRQFIALHNIVNPHSFEAALQPIDEKLLNTPDYVYKKRPLQKRQTKLFKMKFVETR